MVALTEKALKQIEARFQWEARFRHVEFSSVWSDGKFCQVRHCDANRHLHFFLTTPPVSAEDPAGQEVCQHQLRLGRERLQQPEQARIERLLAEAETGDGNSRQC